MGSTALSPSLSKRMMFHSPLFVWQTCRVWWWIDTKLGQFYYCECLFSMLLCLFSCCLLSYRFFFVLAILILNTELSWWADKISVERARCRHTHQESLDHPTLEVQIGLTIEEWTCMRLSAKDRKVVFSHTFQRIREHNLNSCFGSWWCFTTNVIAARYIWWREMSWINYQGRNSWPGSHSDHLDSFNGGGGG